MPYRCGSTHLVLTSLYQSSRVPEVRNIHICALLWCNFWGSAEYSALQNVLPFMAMGLVWNRDPPMVSAGIVTEPTAGAARHKRLTAFPAGLQTSICSVQLNSLPRRHLRHFPLLSAMPASQAVVPHPSHLTVDNAPLQWGGPRSSPSVYVMCADITFSVSAAC